MWTAGIPKFMKFGLSVPMVLRVKFTRQREYILGPDLWDISRPITLLKVGVGCTLLVKYSLIKCGIFGHS